MNSIVLIVLLSASLPLLVLGQQAPADLILLNGKVFTANSVQPYVQAVAIRGERIIAIGTSAEIRSLAGARTRLIDLQGRVVIPGINDAHFHFMPDPKGFTLQFKTTNPSWGETVDAIAAAAKQIPKGTWIFANLGLAERPGAEATRFAIDRVAPDNPVLIRYDGHGYIINSAAMPVLHIIDKEPDPVGGYYERVAGSQRINGKLWEYAQWKPNRFLASQISDQDIIKHLRVLADEAVRDGITSMQIMAFLPIDRFARLLVKADLPIRVRAIPFSMTTTRGRDLSEILQIPKLQFPHSRVTVSGIKWIPDGSPIERAAALRKPYNDRPDWSGKLNFDEADIASMVKESLMFKQQLILHAVGDRTNEALLNGMEKAGTKIDWKSKRVRIEHGDGLLPDLIPRASRLGVVVVVNPTHFTLRDVLNSRYGNDHKYLPLRSLIDAGIQIAMGSDANTDATDSPIGAMNPYLNIMFAAIHPVRPSEAITREQAVEAYTRGSAYAEFAEKEKGTLAIGKQADLIVLSQDIFTAPLDQLPKTHSVFTLVAGKVVYDSMALK
ncbi:MAG: amidohydrolase [Pyrinomonadaceae bacterium]